MLHHAAENLKDRDNVTFVEGLPNVASDARFDLVHSFIVIQHIRPQFGFPIILDLVDKVRSGGFFALHMTVGDFRVARRIMNWFKYRFPPLHWVYNLSRNRSLNEPMTEMNKYDLATLLHLLKGRHQGALVIEPVYQVDYMGIIVIGKRT
jgi:hypothetical protein